jgi:16S rRNA U1498 N3-methylase RsmE
VVHALPRQRKLDEVVQRLSEVRVDRVVPVHSARSQLRPEVAATRLPAASLGSTILRTETAALAAATATLTLTGRLA